MGTGEPPSPSLSASREADSACSPPAPGPVADGAKGPSPSATGTRPVARAAAHSIAVRQTAVELVRFIPFTDLVPCDYNQDGVLDVIVLNSKVSDGYGMTGIGNGLFAQGPCFDLPFRPAGAVSLGSGPEERNGIFLISSAGSVSLFFPLIVEVSQETAPATTFAVLRVDTGSGPLFVVCEAGKPQVHLYGAEGLTVKDLGARASSRVASAADWYGRLVAWQPTSEGVAFPLPPEGTERTTCVADVNGDGIPDLVYYETGKIVWKLSLDGAPLAVEKTAPCPTRPTVVRVADVDGNGLGDVLALMGTSGVLEVYLALPE